ncbi:Ubiquitin-like domain-containing CTD phosphatase 1-like [Homarus americanus]|uniref:Ubiquitin-like domain-containing CTD phosphatase 1 n=1 Tax=Homarus americanus TaxID=6706 RepID=A0A8J5JZY7_HOMAM|nr:Ubiquitin-like domain-containing CTD phosphatase 1-like [Homarus americanus]
MMKTITVKWNGKEYDIEVDEAVMTVRDFKNAIEKQTCVKPHRQKLLNLKLKGKTPDDDTKMVAISLRPGTKIMMMGSLEASVEEVQRIPEDLPPVINDLDIEEEEVAIENRSEYLLKNYDIVIWSATSMKWIKEKMKLLGVSSHPDYKITFYLDSLAMITIETQKYGVIEVKPLGVVWGKYEHYTQQNTIMFDDLRRNFLMNPQNGLKIRAFRQAHQNRATDRELLRLAWYLEDIAEVSDISTLNHSKWEHYRKDGYN